jgi:predicted nucleotidyltransferase
MYLRSMRNSPAIDALLSKPMQGILSALLLEREQPWYMSDLAKRLGRTPSTIQRPLEALVNAGILKRSTAGNLVYFARDPACPFLPELQSLLVKTVGLADIRRELLRSAAQRIRVAFVYGSVARSEQTSQSDVDLFIIGEQTLADLTPILLQAEQRLGRPVNATLLSPGEFRDKLAHKNHFLRSVLAQEKIFVLGTDHVLEELSKPGTGRTARHKPSGTR